MAPYTKADSYAKTEVDNLLAGKENTLLLMDDELQRVLDGSGGQLAFKLGLHSTFLNRITTLETNSDPSVLSVTAGQKVEINGPLEVKQGSIQRGGTNAVGGVYLGEGGTNDYAIEIVGGTPYSACYIDFARPGNDYRCRMLYYLASGQDYLKIFTAAQRSLEVRVSGLSANGYFSFSDERLKDDVKDLSEDDCVSLVKNVKAKSYVRNDIEGDNRRVGFIAQHIQAQATGDLGALIGQANDGDNETFLTVDYPKLTSVLWGVCRNLLSRVEQLEKSSLNTNAQAKRRRT